MVALDPERNPLEVLADDFSARCRRGESPSISEYTSQYPELADQIEGLFPSISVMEDLVRQEQSDRNREQTQTAFTSAPIKRIGDCRIVREISRGGMGIVYEAQQESLDRRVAIKVLPSSSLASSNQLERFHREAQAAAKLRHRVQQLRPHDHHHSAILHLDHLWFHRTTFGLIDLSLTLSPTDAAVVGQPAVRHKVIDLANVRCRCDWRKQSPVGKLSDSIVVHHMVARLCCDSDRIAKRLRLVGREPDIGVQTVKTVFLQIKQGNRIAAWPL